MLQNARVTAFTVSELLRVNQLGGVKSPPTTRLVLNILIDITMKPSLLNAKISRVVATFGLSSYLTF